MEDDKQSWSEFDGNSFKSLFTTLVWVEAWIYNTWNIHLLSNQQNCGD